MSLAVLQSKGLAHRTEACSLSSRQRYPKGAMGWCVLNVGCLESTSGMTGPLGKQQAVPIVNTAHLLHSIICNSLDVPEACCLHSCHAGSGPEGNLKVKHPQSHKLPARLWWCARLRYMLRGNNTTRFSIVRMPSCQSDSTLVQQISP